MRHHIFAPPADNATYRVALMCRPTAFNQQALEQHYVRPLVQQGVDAADVVAVAMEYDSNGAAPAKLIKSVLEHLLPALCSIGTTHLYVTDSAYFKVLTKEAKVDPHYGYVLPCKIDGYEHLKVVLGINYQQIVFNPAIQHKLDAGLNALAKDLSGSYQAPGTGIIYNALYPSRYDEIAQVLRELHQYPKLTVDIEAFSLKFWEAGIGTISFAIDEHNGVAFAVDYTSLPEPNQEGHFGEFRPDPLVRALVRKFFETYEGEIIFHGAAYDVKVIIYVLWMQDLLDQKGLLQGLEIMTRRWHCTRLVAFLALNSTARQEYGLKDLAQEFAGNWAVEVKDIRTVPLADLLRYNLVDCLSTWYVFKKYWPRMVRDQQLPVYERMMLPSQRVLIQVELTGMPMSRTRIQEVKVELTAVLDKALNTIMTHPTIPLVENWRAQKEAVKHYEDRLAKAKNKDKIVQFPWQKYHEPFNVNSGPQMQALLYGFLGLPVIDTTETGQPATGAETIKKLLAHPIGKKNQDLLQAFMDYAGVAKILGTYIPAFEAGVDKGTGDTIWLHGSFKLGFVVSGRLSSEKPNLQNIPANSAYGKLVKTIFQAPEDWLFVGADFNALEDRINTLLTKDPNKLKVFVDGYDSHCLRAFYFFPERLPGITETVASINSIKDNFKDVRQDAKGPAFALQYQGTWITLHKTLGFEEDVAKSIENRFREMYQVSEQWVQEKIKYACKHGYVELAFGLRLRTPMLGQCIYGRHMPYQAQAEARTMGNAVSGQSYGLLNNRAANEFMEQVWASPYRYDILPVGQIHDAQYYLIRNRLEIVHWFNEHLPKAMAWQDLPEIQHPDVKLGAEVDIFYKGWHQPITLPNHATPEQIIELCKKGAFKYDNPQPKEKA